jgi:hypothetical protein
MLGKQCLVRIRRQGVDVSRLGRLSLVGRAVYLLESSSGRTAVTAKQILGCNLQEAAK